MTITELRQLRRWCLYYLTPKNDGSGKFTKSPRDIHGNKIGLKDQSELVTYEEALEYVDHSKGIYIGFSHYDLPDGHSFITLDFDALAGELSDVQKMYIEHLWGTTLGQATKTGGYHFLMHNPGFKKGFDDSKEHGVDYRVNGGIVVYETWVNQLPVMGNTCETGKRIAALLAMKQGKADELGARTSNKTLDQVLADIKRDKNLAAVCALPLGNDKDHSATDILVFNNLVDVCERDPNLMLQVFETLPRYRSSKRRRYIRYDIPSALIHIVAPVVIDEHPHVEQIETAQPDDANEHRVYEELAFDADMFEHFPRPINGMFKDMLVLSIDPRGELLSPMFMPFLGYLLQGCFSYGTGRLPQFVSLGLAVSTGGKDNNTTSIAKLLVDEMQNHMMAKGYVSEHLTSFNDYMNAEITADISFVESVHAEPCPGQMFWLHTEASDLYSKLTRRDSIPSVKALETKLKEVFDGKSISGKAKSGKIIPSVRRPNVQVVLMTQIETMMSQITGAQIQGGLVGRQDIFIDVSKKKTRSYFTSMFNARPEPTEELVDFLSFVFKTCEQFRLNGGERMDPVRVMPSRSALENLGQWFEVEAQKFIKSSNVPDIDILIERTQMSAEKMFTICGAYQYLYWLYENKQGIDLNHFKNNQLELVGDLDFIKPYLEYQWRARAWLMGERVNDTPQVMDLFMDAVRQTVISAANIHGKALHPEKKDILYVKHSLILSMLVRKFKRAKWQRQWQTLPRHIKMKDLLELFLKNNDEVVEDSFATMRDDVEKVVKYVGIEKSVLT